MSTAAPAIAASEPGPAPNDEANYYWNVAANAHFITVAAAESHLQFQVSAQVSYRADPWVSPPDGATLQIVIDLSQPAQLSSVGAGWVASPATGTTASSFTFPLAPASQGGGLSATFFGTEAGELTAHGTMSVLEPARRPGRRNPRSTAGR
ncbi:hypothetical protein I8D64_16245 [Brachybacterium sp. MASK1Z-5]|uniref:Uncharacterized protein n=1 Tax=Brachybacterium halotolerans TaxID=2795215 RepID=A0ABS1BE98_9MICO|nr:hypothetical protein [Brachybacterium halotolerans]MBK0332955.1 hypothetical protein [Brachybacterium halotolerans]